MRFQFFHFESKKFVDFVGEGREFSSIVLDFSVLTKFFKPFVPLSTHREQILSWVLVGCLYTRKVDILSNIYSLYVSVQSNRTLLKEGPMNKQETYWWQAAYMFAILETDEAQIRSRIYEAIAAIDQGRSSQVNAKEEDLALTDAEEGIKILITERTANTV